MSNDKPSSNPVINIANPVPSETGEPTETKRPNVLVRAARKIKSTPPKTAIAVVGGVALVSAGAILGRKSASYHVELVESPTEPEPVLQLTEAEEPSSTTETA
jgi:hypothetical protein